MLCGVNGNASVEFPDEILKRKKVEFVTISPINDSVGISCLSGKFKNLHLLRLYQLMRDDEDQKFYPTHEIGAFTFYSRTELVEFVNHLPEMSAFEILMLLNPYPGLQN